MIILVVFYFMYKKMYKICFKVFGIIRFSVILVWYLIVLSLKWYRKLNKFCSQIVVKSRKVF